MKSGKLFSGFFTALGCLSIVVSIALAVVHVASLFGIVGGIVFLTVAYALDRLSKMEDHMLKIEKDISEQTDYISLKLDMMKRLKSMDENHNNLSGE
ncbi:MAG TPA: hypothetical protein DCX90_11725 [Ruminococcaceae bacterium]|jgi:cobalamin biosynthesis protein CobD/CbiB|nr:hypothetical protein [Oscillospiraceae bacterium]